MFDITKRNPNFIVNVNLNTFKSIYTEEYKKPKSIYWQKIDNLNEYLSRNKFPIEKDHTVFNWFEAICDYMAEKDVFNNKQQQRYFDGFNPPRLDEVSGYKEILICLNNIKFERDLKSSFFINFVFSNVDLQGGLSNSVFIFSDIESFEYNENKVNEFTFFQGYILNNNLIQGYTRLFQHNSESIQEPQHDNDNLSSLKTNNKRKVADDAIKEIKSNSKQQKLDLNSSDVAPFTLPENDSSTPSSPGSPTLSQLNQDSIPISEKISPNFNMAPINEYLKKTLPKEFFDNDEQDSDDDNSPTCSY
jgi:hypothetical protein